jgi:large subunit ribosomal protein L23
MKDPRDIIIKPLVTEKATSLMDEGKYVFVVEKHANKIEIRKAIETLFGVQVDVVNTVNVKGKPKRVGAHSGFRSDRKKAIIKLKEGSKPIEIFE